MSDEKGERKYFRCKRFVGNGIDLSKLDLRVIYQNASGFGSYHLENVIKWRKEVFEVVESKSEQQREEMKETKEINEESKLDVLKRKIDTLLESQATIMNAVGSVMCMSEIKDEDLKMKNAIFENLINHRDECMKEVYGESYEELFKTMDKVVNNLGDILDKIFK
jgi:molecular chaperone GrpE (heat shock protein)